MRDGNPAPVTRLTDYRPPAWLVDHTRLDVDLRDGHATVTAELTVRRNPARDDRPGELVLDGEHLELLSLSVDDRPLGEPDYRLEEGRAKRNLSEHSQSVKPRPVAPGST